MSYTRVNEAAYSGLGGDTALDAVLGVIKDPTVITTRATQLTNELVGRLQAVKDIDLNLKAETFKYIYTQSRALLGVYANRPDLKPWLSAVDRVYGTVGTVCDSTFVKQLTTKGGQLDASGVADGFMLIKAAAKSVTAIGLAAGMDEELAKNINDWVGIGVGCAAGIASGAAAGLWPGVAAAVGCAVAALVKILSTKYNPEQVPSWVPRALYTPQIVQQAQLQSDAARLAAVLHTYYGFNNFDTVRQLLWTPRSGAASYIESSYPAAPRVGAGGQLDLSQLSADGQNIPGVSARSVLHVLADLRRWTDLDAIDWSVRLTLNFIAQLNWNAAGWPGERSVDDGGPCGVFNRYYDADDVNVAAISIGAAVGRAMVARNGDATFYCNGRVHDFSPFIRLEELIHFFMAVTYREHAQGLHPEPEYVFLGGGFLPVRFLKATTQAGKPYSPICWTSLYSGSDRCDISAEGSGLAARVAAEDYWAMKEYAFIRVLAALSHMLNQYNWTAPPRPRADLIAEIAKEPLHEFQTPVDPRQIVEVGSMGFRFNEAHTLNEISAPEEVRQVVIGNEGSGCVRDGFFSAAGRRADGGTYDVPLRGKRNCDNQCPNAGAYAWHLQYEPVRNGRRLAGVIQSREAILGGVIAEARQLAAQDSPKYNMQMLTYGVTVNAAATPGTPEYEAAQKGMNPLLIGAIAFALIKLLK